MSELQPREHEHGVVVPRHIPQLVVPIPMDHVREFVRGAVSNSSLANPTAQVLSGWAFFKPYVRYSAVDDEHTRIEIDVVGRVRGAETLLYPERRAEIDRFFVAIQDELDRIAKWTSHQGSIATVLDGSMDVVKQQDRIPEID